MGEKRPIRVAHIIGKMWAGGVESVVFNYYRNLDHDKVQFDFYYDADSTVEPPEDLLLMGARFYKMPPYQRIWKYIPELRLYLKNNGYGIVHSHLNTLSVFPLFVAWTLGIPIRIAHNHSVPKGDGWKRTVLKLILKQFSKVFATEYFACSDSAGRWLFGDKALKNGKVLVINNAIDFSKFAISEEVIVRLKNELNISHKLVIGHVGRFTFAKNHRKLLDIFRCILNKNPNAVLLLVGDGELRDQIMYNIEELNLQENVICTGKVSNPQDYYALMDVLILPSHFEGFPVTVLEAQAARVPIIVSDVVPVEACIGTGCEFKSVLDSSEDWACEAIRMTQLNCKLDQSADNYNIKHCVTQLQNWYLDHS